MTSGEVLHFSEDPTITRFAPHIAATAQQPQPYVWALTAEQARRNRSGDAVAAGTLNFSGIRLRNAVPRRTGSAPMGEESDLA